MSIFYNTISISFFFYKRADLILINVFVNRKFKFKSLYFVGCVQVLNRLKNACPQPAHPVSRLKESYMLISLKLPTLKALCLKAFKRILDFKRECGSSSPKLTPLTHPLVNGVSLGEERSK